MRRLVLFAALTLAACDSPSEPAPIVSVTGAWNLSAEAGGCSLEMRAIIREGDSEAFSGYGTLRMKKPAGYANPHTSFEGGSDGIRFTEIYQQAWAPYRVPLFTLAANESGTDHLSGVWTCDGAAGSWEMLRETH